MFLAFPALRIAIVNRFAPPDAAPTGQAAARLAFLLGERLPGAVMTLVASTATYHCRPGLQVPDGLRIVRVPSFYDGRHPVGRGVAWLWESWALARRAVREGDVVIALTDPPLLPLLLQPLVQRAGGRWVQWCMDLYPDILAATGTVSSRSWLYGGLCAAAARLRPDWVLCLGPGQGARLAARRPGVLAGLLPAGLLDPASESACQSGYAGNGPVTLVYAGNLGAVHCPESLAALVEASSPARHHFVLAVHGRGAAALRRRLGDHPGVVWRDHLSLAELAAVDVHVVSLAAPAGQCCVPAKAISAVCLGRPVLFLGPAEADLWVLLDGAGWQVDAESMAATLEAVTDPACLRAKTAAAVAVAARLRERERMAVATLADFLAAAPSGG